MSDACFSSETTPTQTPHPQDQRNDGCWRETLQELKKNRAVACHRPPNHERASSHQTSRPPSVQQSVPSSGSFDDAYIHHESVHVAVDPTIM